MTPFCFLVSVNCLGGLGRVYIVHYTITSFTAKQQDRSCFLWYGPFKWIWKRQMDDGKRQTPDDSLVRNVNMKKCSRFIHHSLCMLKYTLLSRRNPSLITWSSKLKNEILQRTCKIQRNILVFASFLTCHITVDLVGSSTCLLHVACCIFPRLLCCLCSLLLYSN